MRTLEQTGDAHHDRFERVLHIGTFNANPLSAAAGVQALELVAHTPVNDTANARADQLKAGLNDLLTRMEVQGCVTGVASLIFLRLGLDPEKSDPETNPNILQDLREAANPARDQQMSLALMNHGVDSGNRFILMSAHSEQDINDTVDAAGKALTEVREQGLI